MVSVLIWIRLLIAFACVFAASAQNIDSMTENPCTAFTFNQYYVDEDTIITTIDGITNEDCQTFCNVVHEDVCYFFMYEKTNGTCTLIKEPLSTYLDTCDLVGGPKTPTIAECNESSDPCKVCTVSYKLK